MMMIKHLHAAIHCVYWDSDSHRSQRSDIPSAEGTESLMPYLRYFANVFINVYKICAS